MDESEQHRDRHVDLDPYLLNKHLNGISSTVSNLIEANPDQSVSELFDENKSSYKWETEAFNPRSIRPPPFSQYIKQVRESRTKPKSTQRRSARIPVRTTKAEQLKLARQRSASEHNSSLPYLRSSATTSRPRVSHHSTISSLHPLTRLRTTSNHTYRQTESARSCKEALHTSGPLTLSSMLIKQMREDIKSNRGN